jgi:amino acid transporter
MEKVNNVPEQNEMILEKGPEGKLGLLELSMLAIGQVIGAGVIALIGPAIGMTGKSIWLSYVLAIILGFFVALPFLILAGSVRLSGGPYSIVQALVDDKFAGIFIVGQIPATIGTALYGVGVGNYLKSLFPSLNVQIVAAITLTIFYLISLGGIDFVAKIQKYMGYLLLVCLTIFVALGLTHVDFSVMDVTGTDFMSNGTGGLFSAMFLLSFSTYGYYYVIGYGRNAKNARKDIPLAMLYSIPIIIVLYVGAAIVAAGVLPIGDVAGKPLTLVAKAVLPGALFALFIVGGALMALMTSLNSSIGFFANMFYSSSLDGWLPKVFTKKNKMQSAYWVMTLIYVLAMLPVILNFNVSQITNNILLFNSSLTFLTYFAIFRLPNKFPTAWQNSKIRISKTLFYIIMTICSAAQVAVFIYSIRGVGVTVAIVSIAALVLSALYAQLRYKSGHVNSQVNVWSD